MQVTRTNDTFSISELTTDEIELILEGIVVLKNNNLPASEQFRGYRRSCTTIFNAIQDELIASRS